MTDLEMPAHVFVILLFAVTLLSGLFAAIWLYFF
jgi:hypothetical protein